MPTTLTPTCPLCGLRYADRPLLELHVREDHRVFKALSRERRVNGHGGDRVAGGGRA